MENFLNTIDAYLPFWSTGFSKGKWKSETLTDIVTYLASKLEMDDTSGVAYNQKRADDYDSEIKTLLQRRTSEAIQTLKAVTIENCG